MLELDVTTQKTVFTVTKLGFFNVLHQQKSDSLLWHKLFLSTVIHSELFGGVEKKHITGIISINVTTGRLWKDLKISRLTRSVSQKMFVNYNLLIECIYIQIKLIF